MCDADHRLGSNNIEEILNHPFFEKVNWNRLRGHKSPWVPELKSDEDCVNFDHFDEEEPFIPVENGKTKKGKRDLQFIGYTFNKHVEEQKANFVKALNESLQPDPAQSDNIDVNQAMNQRAPQMNEIQQMGQGGSMANNMMQQQKLKQAPPQQMQQKQPMQQLKQAPQKPQKPQMG